MRDACATRGDKKNSPSPQSCPDKAEYLSPVKLATIETIRGVEPHRKADRLDLVRVGGWQCVVKRGEFQAGDRVVFVAIDTLLSPAHWNRFLADKDFPDNPIRLKTVRLRGEYSQGLVLPLSVLPEALRVAEDGFEVSQHLGITKYEKELPAGLAGVAIGGFPAALCAKTDEENGLSNDQLVQEVLQSPVTVTRKLDGSSCTVIFEGNKITHVCSRRLQLKQDESSRFWRAARKLSSVSTSDTVVIQGELMGPGIQGNQLGLKDGELFVFQVSMGGCFLPYQEMFEFCRGVLGCQVVPLIIDAGRFSNTEELQFLADEQKLDSGEFAEGIVVRPVDYRAGGDGRPLGFKLINRAYKD